MKTENLHNYQSPFKPGQNVMVRLTENDEFKAGIIQEICFRNDMHSPLEYACTIDGESPFQYQLFTEDNVKSI